MIVGSSVVLVLLALGLIVGSIAGYYGGGIDQFLNVVTANAFLSFQNPAGDCVRSLRGPGIRAT
jgi:ABC-type dipeptide/oligopeptide/nickel transport system permease subunit